MGYPVQPVQLVKEDQEAILAFLEIQLKCLQVQPAFKSQVLREVGAPKEIQGTLGKLDKLGKGLLGKKGIQDVLETVDQQGQEEKMHRQDILARSDLQDTLETWAQQGKQVPPAKLDPPVKQVPLVQ
jgi:hypothetical protein